MNWKLQRFDKSEQYVFWGLVGTFLLDVISTIFFVSRGLGDQEANLAIYHYGWLWGGLYALVINIAVIYGFTLGIQNARNKSPIKRFAGIAVSVLLIFFRALVVISNFYFTLTTPVNPGPVSTSDLFSFWVPLMIILYLVYTVIIFSFNTFRMTTHMVYNPGEWRTFPTFKERFTVRCQQIKRFIGIKDEKIQQ